MPCAVCRIALLRDFPPDPQFAFAIAYGAAIATGSVTCDRCGEIRCEGCAAASHPDCRGTFEALP